VMVLVLSKAIALIWAMALCISLLLLAPLCGSIPYRGINCNWVEITSAQGQAITNSVMAVSTIDQSPDAKQNRYGKY
jgi:voltage-gated potassium channel Kch